MPSATVQMLKFQVSKKNNLINEIKKDVKALWTKVWLGTI